MPLDRISIELTNACSKACWFCYNHSRPEGASRWSVPSLVRLVEDCARHGVQAISFGGGEPLEFGGLVELLMRLRGVVFRSLTTNGLLLTDTALDALARAAPDKVHVSIHFPEDPAEVARAIRQVQSLQQRGIAAGINLLVRKSNLLAAQAAADQICRAGLDSNQLVLLPMRGFDTPTPHEVAGVSPFPAFQSMTCLAACGKSQRFCSIAWDQTVAWCSYTVARRPLPDLTYSGLVSALEGLEVAFCGGTPGQRQQLYGLAQQTHTTPPSTYAASTSPQPLSFTAAAAASPTRVCTDIEGSDTETAAAPLVLSRELPSSGMSAANLPAADFPASHSMDVSFYTVDRDGLVAHFWAYLDEYGPIGEALQFTAAQMEFSQNVRTAISQIPGAGQYGHNVIFNFGWVSGDDQNNAFVYQPAEEPPQQPELLREALLLLQPYYARWADYSWLSFNDALELPWPPRRPVTRKDWTKLLDNATQNWLNSLDRLKRAERKHWSSYVYWQNIADRQYASLQRLETEVIAWQKQLPT